MAAPAPPQAPTFMGLEVNAKTGGLVLESGVMFGAGSATLKTRGKTILKRLASELNAPKFAESKVRIEGHTDATPIKRSGHKSNWDLSGKRAMAVLHYLEKIGVSSDRLCFAGFASHQPIDDGQGKSSLARNRRVEIVLAE
ncbi:MAG: OmpA family protein [Planctomycetes bacterium]|nr:OmpA family protein [Planctomycetota bacterium]